MPDYIGPEIDDASDDPNAIADDIREYLASLVPGWSVWPASPTNYLIEGFAVESAETRRAATGVGQTYDQIARWLGQSVFATPARDPGPAFGSSTWTAIDTDGPYTIEAGTQITLRSPDGNRVGFEVTADATIPAGQATVTGVQIVCVEDGTVGNDLTADPRPEDEMEFVSTIVIEAPTSGGTDGETDAAYLDRFARAQRRRADVLILPEHFSAFAVDFFGDSGRATTLRLYNADTGTEDVPGHFTVLTMSPTGTARTQAQMDALLEAIQARVMPGVVPHVLAPVFTPIDVTFQVSIYAPYDAATVQTSAIQAVTDFLSPMQWGAAPYGDEPEWLNETTVRADDIVGVLKRVDGVRHVISVAVNGVEHGNVQMASLGSMPTPGSIAGFIVES